MNIYDYRTIPPEESAYHARTSHASDSSGASDSSEYGDGDLPEEDTADSAGSSEPDSTDPSEPDSADFGADLNPKDIIPDEVPRRDGPGGN